MQVIIMKKAYKVRILFAALILVLSLMAFESAYYFTVKYYEDDLPFWETEDNFNSAPQKTDDDVIETTTTPLFLLVENNGYVVVEYFQGGEIYDETSIHVRDLPEDLQREIINGIPIKNFSELYDFLENFSS